MEMIPGLWRLLWHRPERDRQVPLPSGTDQAIQEGEQKAAQDRLLTYARRLPNERVHNNRWAR
ncbi:hypothetical protein ACQEUX_08720 [Micromonospora sp. CA-259024]|uniref:hypothetical protein n=1 Tax=Micromonospora sp. CA-259024 TaxID=3239965 RepID=UPI003D9384E8